jgi:hypothetical protein
MGAISVLIGVLIIVVVGAICFWAIERFAPEPAVGKFAEAARGACLPGRDCVR